MRAVVILLVLIAATAASFYLVWMNRASEKIIGAVIPIAVAALVGVGLAVLVFGSQPPISTTFPSSFLIHIENKLPWEGLLTSNRKSSVVAPFLLRGEAFQISLFAPAQLYKAHPESFSDPTDSNGRTLYHDLLQRAIVDWMAMVYRANWQAEIRHFELPAGQFGTFGPATDATEPSDVLASEKIVTLLQGNKFAEIHTVSPPEIALPPGTKMLVRVPRQGGSTPEAGEILLVNDFCKLSMQTHASIWMRGVGGYNLLAGLSEEENNKLATVTYIVTIKVEFSRLRSGHPQMPKYRAWASQLVDELKRQFDEQIIWAKTKEAYLFWRQMQQYRQGR